MDIIVTKFPVTSAQCIPTFSFISFLDVVVVVVVVFVVFFCKREDR